MRRREAIGILGIAALGGVGVSAQRGRGNIDPSLLTPVTSTPPGVREKFAGLWRLVSYASHGDHPSGRVFYDTKGNMTGQLLPVRKALPQNPTIEDFQNLNRGLVSYYGTYDVDPATNRVVHHLEGASNPAWAGTDFFRWYEISGSRLTLRTSPNSTNPLIWERMAD
jgi:hypothetical protein